MKAKIIFFLTCLSLCEGVAQTNPLWNEKKVKNYLPHMTVPEDSPLQVGDMVSFGVGHPCLTFDKWQVLVVVNDEYNVVGAVRTFF